MAKTYTQLFIQVVFTVKYRKAAIHPFWKAELYRYITVVIQSYEHKLLIINGMPDHIHLLIGLNPSHSLSDLIKKVKANSSRWINQKHLTPRKFQWQAGYGAFSYNKSQVPNLIRYIKNQEIHHHKYTFSQEYRNLLDTFEIDYDPNDLFDFDLTPGD